MKDYQKLIDSLDKLDKDFNIQVHALDSDIRSFHRALIKLTAKYPEHHELLEFIVNITDRLELNHNLFSEIMTGTFTESIKIKKQIVVKLLEEKTGQISTNSDEEKSNFVKKLIKIGVFFKEAKIIFASIAVVAITAGAIISPDSFLVILKAIAKIIP